MALPGLKGNAYVPFTCNLAIIMVLLQFALIGPVPYMLPKWNISFM